MNESSLSEFWKKRLEDFQQQASVPGRKPEMLDMICNYSAVCRASMEMALAVENVKRRKEDVA